MIILTTIVAMPSIAGQMDLGLLNTQVELMAQTIVELLIVLRIIVTLGVVNLLLWKVHILG